MAKDAARTPLRKSSDFELERLILKNTHKPVRRGVLITQVVREAFCVWEVKEIRGVIEKMLVSRRLRSATGKTRINDSVEVWDEHGDGNSALDLFSPPS